MEFQELFVRRWFVDHMAPRLREESGPLIEYTEPINTRIARKERGLDADQREHLARLVEEHFMLAMGFLPMHTELPGRTDSLAPPELPLRDGPISPLATDLPPEVLDATALRPLLDALVDAYRRATEDFDLVFGERA